MATQISLVNNTNGRVSVDVKLDEDRAIRANLAPGATQALSGVQLDELDANTELQALISAGTVSLSLTDGPTMMLRVAIPTSGTDVVVENPTAHAYRVMDATLIVATAVGASTVTLRDATGGGGNALSSDMSAAATGRVADASTATTTVAAGGALIANKSAAGIGGEILVTVQRTS